MRLISIIFTTKGHDLNSPKKWVSLIVRKIERNSDTYLRIRVWPNSYVSTCVESVRHGPFSASPTRQELIFSFLGSLLQRVRGVINQWNRANQNPTIQRLQNSARSHSRRERRGVTWVRARKARKLKPRWQLGAFFVAAIACRSRARGSAAFRKKTRRRCCCCATNTRARVARLQARQDSWNPRFSKMHARDAHDGIGFDAGMLEGFEILDARCGKWFSIHKFDTSFIWALLIYRIIIDAKEQSILEIKAFLQQTTESSQADNNSGVAQSGHLEDERAKLQLTLASIYYTLQYRRTPARVI